MECDKEIRIARADIEAIAATVAKELTSLLAKKRWLSLKEAATEFKIGEHRLKHLGKTGIIKGFQDPDSNRGDWIFDRHSLDAYRERQAGNTTSIDEKILALKARVRL